MSMILNALGANLLFFFPVWGAIKPFDIIAILVIFIAVVSGKKLRFLKLDYLFGIFIFLSLVSAALADTAQNSSFLQSFRYLFYFFLARFSWTEGEVNSIFKGYFIGITIAALWIIIDILQYYIIMDCRSLASRVFFWVEYLPTHKSPYWISNCLILRPSGFAWDPGGFYPLLLFSLAVLDWRKAFRGFFFFSIVAVSRTAILAVIASKTSSFLQGFPKFLFFLLALFLGPYLGYVLMSINEIPVNFGTAGTWRHFAYPKLALETIFHQPSFLFLGEGLRGGAAGLAWVEAEYFTMFFDKGVLETQSIAVVESIWVNQILGAGLLAFSAYALWLSRYYRSWTPAFIIIVVSGIFYTFDSSQFCFLIPFLMSHNHKLVGRP